VGGLAVLNSKKVQKKIKTKSAQKKVEIAQSLHRSPAVRDVLHFSRACKWLIL
jgi:hypothetical protein